MHAALEIIRKTEKHVSAQCTFNPVWIDVTTAHYCGRWDGPLHEQTVQDVIWGSRLQRMNNDLHYEVADLKARLKNSRRISASRLARLKPNSSRSNAASNASNDTQ